MIGQGIGLCVNQTQGVDKSALAIGAAEFFRLFDFRKSARDVLWRKRWLPQLMEISHGDAPVRRGAIGIFGCHIPKCFFRCRICERMQKRDRSLKTFLYFGRARSSKLDIAKLLRDGMLMFRDGGQRLPTGACQQNKENNQCEHGTHY